MIADLIPYENLIALGAEKYHLDPKLVGAIIMQESSGRMSEYRYEPKSTFSHLAPLYAKRLNITFETELVMQHCSWGLMQVMGFKAREIGYEDHLPLLLLPSKAIEWGCKALFTLQRTKLEDTIAAYNAGSPIMNLAGGYINQGYVDGVKAWMAKI